MLTLTLSQSTLKKWRNRLDFLFSERAAVIMGIILSVIATAYSYFHGYIVAYGDAESHLNIAKRVVESLTPGFAQLGGIWLPLPHLLLVPFVDSDFLWRTGLAGSIVSGTAYVITGLFLYKLVFLITKNKAASFVASMVFLTNPNILYMQSTPMTELTLIVFFVMSSYFFIKFLENDRDLLSFILAAFFGFCAALSRYDGWFLVMVEAGVLFLIYLPWARIPRKLSELKTGFDKKRWEKLQGRIILFSILAMFGIALWLLWGYLILGDPLYFTHSQFSAKSQQNSWLARGELPGYRNPVMSFLYYFVTSMDNTGVVAFVLAIAGFVYFFFNRESKHRYYLLLILLAPFIFNVGSLYLGQSVIFNPSLTPITFQWRLFNVRYGIMMVPFAAACAAYLFYKSRIMDKMLVAALLMLQLGLFGIGYSTVVSLKDGVVGLSSATAKQPDAQFWLAKNYDKGLLLVDDYARTVSIIRTKIPMQNVIYVGNKPYWDVSLKEPEKYATWIVMQRNDAVWTSIYDDPVTQGRLFKYFQKVYTSPDIMIFKRSPEVN